MTLFINSNQVRVLGALIEKEATTPEYYPLSLNALLNACNQKNNREPVLQLTEGEVRDALHRLQDLNLAGALHESRVTKYEHHFQEVFNLTRGETALLCVLLLRGPQTPGELRGRTERMHRFEEIDEVLSALDKLAQHDPPLVATLPRQPGSREVRYAHLLSGPPELQAPAARALQVDAAVALDPSDRERLMQLEAEVAALREEIAELKAQVAVRNAER